jgi:hypothetical protein
VLSPLVATITAAITAAIASDIAPSAIAVSAVPASAFVASAVAASVAVASGLAVSIAATKYFPYSPWELRRPCRLRLRHTSITHRSSSITHHPSSTVHRPSSISNRSAVDISGALPALHSIFIQPCLSLDLIIMQRFWQLRVQRQRSCTLSGKGIQRGKADMALLLIHATNAVLRKFISALVPIISNVHTV